MGKTSARITGVPLSVVTILLGATISVLLYYAGQRAIDLFYPGTSTDRGHIQRRNPADDWYGQILQKGWIAGFIYILSGITGLTSALFYNTSCMAVHLIVLVAMVTVSSFLHCGGGMLLVLYHVLEIGGATRYQPFFGDCLYFDGVYPYDVHEDTRCLAGREAMIMGLSALGVMFVAWMFMLSDMLFRSFTFYQIKKQSLSNTSVSASTTRRHRPNKHARLTPQSAPKQPDDTQRNSWLGGEDVLQTDTNVLADQRNEPSSSQQELSRPSTVQHEPTDINDVNVSTTFTVHPDEENLVTNRNEPVGYDNNAMNTSRL